MTKNSKPGYHHYHHILHIFIWFVTLSGCKGQCYNNCNQHGICNKLSQCECFTGYEGNDCSKRTCPKGVANVDIAYAEDRAHQQTTCSGRGKCNTQTGTCECDRGFSGIKCDRLECPNDCSNHGTCISLRTAANAYDGWTLNHTTIYNLWDADYSTGCQCDPGWTGYDCSQKMCDYGADPRTSTYGHEVIKLVCTCAAACTGSFKLRVLGEIANTNLSPSSTASDLAEAIMSVPGFYQESSASLTSPVSVYLSSGTTICDTAMTVVSSIHFIRKGGDVSALSLNRNRIAGGSLYFQTEHTLRCNCEDSLCSGYFNLAYDAEISSQLSIFDTHDDVINALTSLKTFKASSITYGSELVSPAISMSGVSSTQICQLGQITNHTIYVNAAIGNLPRIQLFSATNDPYEVYGYSTNESKRVLSMFSNDGRDKGVKVCNGLGKCDKNGKCSCSFGWTGASDFGPCGALKINSSDWNGLARCPGLISKEDGRDLSRHQNHQRLYVSLNPVWNDYSTPANISTIELLPYSNRKDVVEMLNWPDTYRTHYPRIPKNESSTVLYNLTSNSSAGPMVVDRAGDYLYFVDNNPNNPHIGRLSLNVNATDITGEQWIMAVGIISGLAIDAHYTGRKLYWTIPGLGYEDDGKIYWASLDATSPVAQSLTATIGQANLIDPKGIRIHYNEEKLYWLDVSLVSSDWVTVINTCDLDGSNFKTRMTYLNYDNVSMPANATDLTIDLNNNTLMFFNTKYPLGLIETNLNKPTYLNQTQNNTRDYYKIKSIWKRTDVDLVDPAYVLFDDLKNVILWTDLSLQSINFFDITRPEMSAEYSGELKNFIYSRKAPVGLALDLGMDEPYRVEYFDCYGHGRCLGLSGNWECECDEGYYGDCRQRSCPRGYAWFSEQIVDNIAHDVLVECSGAGICDSSTGECVCRDGYEGPACERSTCPKGDSNSFCNGNGRCMSMRHLAEQHADNYLTPEPLEYGKQYHDPTTWDADRIFGCATDKYGFIPYTSHNISSYTGSYLSERECPYGYDPRLTDSLFLNQSQQLKETQRLSCRGSGNFNLIFRGETCGKIHANTTIEELSILLRTLPTIGNITVESDTSNSGGAVCSSTQTNIVKITFNSNLGPLPLIEITSSSGSFTVLEVDRLVEAAGELYSCSGRGECDTDTGLCKCWPYRTSSDGFGGVGIRGDCGFNSML